jgi:cellulose synthase/poly-beta-1,6-N-acetylglucosamine synthase-like glycosyltransferase
MAMWDNSFHWYIYLLDAAALLYLGLVGLYTYGWYNLRKSPQTLARNENTIKVSILIAARNEQDHIPQLLQSLYDQQYPHDLMEVWLVDDHSEDDTANRVVAFKTQNTSFQLKLIKNKGQGKKAALRTALLQSNADLVLITDADCLLPPGWVSAMVAHFCEANHQLLLGPVRLKQQKSLFGKLQALEFISLMGSTAGAAGAGFPVMGNGANIGVNRQTALELNAFDESEYASGDDMFLLMAVRKQFGSKAVRFVRADDAIVETEAQPHLSAFMQQRMRWVSKSRGYRDKNVVLPALVVLFFNLMLGLTLVLGMTKELFLMVFVLFVLLKFLVDYPLLYLATGFLRRRKLMPYALFLEFAYPLYVVVTGLAGLILPFRWKGRRYIK